MSYLNTVKGRESYIKHIKSIKAYKRKRRESLSKIAIISKNDKVKIDYKDNIYEGIVKRINSLSYGISFNNRYVKIDKESLSGYPEDIVKSYTGDSRRYIGENVRLII